MLFFLAIRATALVCLKDFVYFTQKNLLFLFYTIPFTKHLHQFIYYIHFFIKIIFLHPFSIISHLTPTSFFFESEYTPIFILFSLSLSLPLFLLFLLFFFFFENLFLSSSSFTIWVLCFYYGWWFWVGFD